MAENQYTFLKSRTREIVPCINSHPLHSMIDPKREAERLIYTIEDSTGFLVILGLGGGFLPEAALELTNKQVIVIDYDHDNLKELFTNKDYSKLIKNNRFKLLLNPSNKEIELFIIEHYKPALDGGIQVIPLRTRTEINKPIFDSAIQSIQDVIGIVSGDYTVQAHFGKRWFSNIIRNIKLSVKKETAIDLKQFAPVCEAAIVAAGPSLDIQLQSLKDLKTRKVLIISSDTALPVLVSNGIIPDIVVSIDCQHISYYHFKGLNTCLKGIPLILDIASPPMLSGFSSFSPIFFSSGHPLARYVSNNWQPLPHLDTSGGNVTYACLSLAEYLGVRQITLFGADFSYINSQTYAKGTYIYPYFNKKQNRFSTIEQQSSVFLYRSPFLPEENPELIEPKNYYETASLRFYRKKLEEKTSMMHAEITCAKGLGVPIKFNNLQKQVSNEPKTVISKQEEKISGIDFLLQYRNDIAALPKANDKENYFKKLNNKEISIFLTLLPYVAVIRKQNPQLKRVMVIEEVKNRCIAEIEKVL